MQRSKETLIGIYIHFDIKRFTMNYLRTMHYLLHSDYCVPKL